MAEPRYILLSKLCNNTAKLLYKHVKSSGCTDVNYQDIIEVFPRDEESANIHVETNNKDIADIIDNLLENTIGNNLVPSTIDDPDTYCYYLTISFENLLTVYTWLSMRYK